MPMPMTLTSIGSYGQAPEVRLQFGLTMTGAGAR